MRRERLETQLAILKMHALRSSIASVLSVIEFLIEMALLHSVRLQQF